MFMYFLCKSIASRLFIIYEEYLLWAIKVNNS